MKRVILESPYAGKGSTPEECAAALEKNLIYARECMRHSISQGEAPFASHLLYTQKGILRDDILNERKLGIECGFQWRHVADGTVFYTDLGWSSGMLLAVETMILTRSERTKVRLRAIRGEVQLPQSVNQQTLGWLLDVLQLNKRGSRL